MSPSWASRYSSGGVCPDVPVTALSYNQIYTAETSQNCFCVNALSPRALPRLCSSTSPLRR
jgi:hypothetical protein